MPHTSIDSSELSKSCVADELKAQSEIFKKKYIASQHCARQAKKILDTITQHLNDQRPATDILREEKDNVVRKFGAQIDDMKQGLKENQDAYNHQILSLNKEFKEIIQAVRKYSNMKVKQMQVITSDILKGQWRKGKLQGSKYKN